MSSSAYYNYAPPAYSASVPPSSPPKGAGGTGNGSNSISPFDSFNLAALYGSSGSNNKTGSNNNNSAKSPVSAATTSFFDRCKSGEGGANGAPSPLSNAADAADSSLAFPSLQPRHQQGQYQQNRNDQTQHRPRPNNHRDDDGAAAATTMGYRPPATAGTGTGTGTGTSTGTNTTRPMSMASSSTSSTSSFSSSFMSMSTSSSQRPPDVAPTMSYIEKHVLDAGFRSNTTITDVDDGDNVGGVEYVGSDEDVDGGHHHQRHQQQRRQNDDDDDDNVQSMYKSLSLTDSGGGNDSLAYSQSVTTYTSHSQAGNQNIRFGSDGSNNIRRANPVRSESDESNGYGNGNVGIGAATAQGGANLGDSRGGGYYDPWATTSTIPEGREIVPSTNNGSADPFGVFVTTPTAPMVSQPPAATAAAAGDDDFWSAMGFAAAPAPTTTAAAAPSSPPAPAPAVNAYDGDDGAIVPASPSSSSYYSCTSSKQQQQQLRRPIRLDPITKLPKSGTTYVARIQTPSLGVIFFTPAELRSNLLSRFHPDAIKSLNHRPVVGHVFEGEAAATSGVMRGHVLLKVNDRAVHTPHEAKDAMRGEARPLTLEFWIPPESKKSEKEGEEEEEVNVEAEGNDEDDIGGLCNEEGPYMVKYDTVEMVANPSQWEWKPKYVVVGGIIAKPWMMMMYKSKAEYDIAVRATMAERDPKVKVKSFDLRGAKIYNDMQSPMRFSEQQQQQPRQRISAFSNISTPCRPDSCYFTIVPKRGYPIKIMSWREGRLLPVLEAVRRALRGEYMDSIYQADGGGWRSGHAHEKHEAESYQRD